MNIYQLCCFRILIGFSFVFERLYYLGKNMFYNFKLLNYFLDIAIMIRDGIHLVIEIPETDASLFLISLTDKQY